MYSTVGKRKKKYFSKYRKPMVPLPDLSGPQKKSYQWFLSEGMWEIFQEYSPIKDQNDGNKFELSFVSYKIGKPSCTEQEALENHLDYSAPLKIVVRLKNKTLKTTKDQEILFSSIPVITERGTFILGGNERVIVSQLKRSPGVFFTKQMIRGIPRFSAKIVSQKGSWAEFDSDLSGTCTIRIDRKTKFPVTTLLRVMGLKTDAQILSSVKDKEAKEMLKKTLEEDPVRSYEDACIVMYKKIRSGDQVAFQQAETYVETIFSKERFNFSPIGRNRFNTVLGLPLTKREMERQHLEVKDILSVLSVIAKKNATPHSEGSDIDSLMNRRVIYVGELFQMRIRKGLARLERNIQDKMTVMEKTHTLPLTFVNVHPFKAVVREFFVRDSLSHTMRQQNLVDEMEHNRTLSALGVGGVTREHAGFAVRDIHPSHYGRICPIHTPDGSSIGLNVHLSLYARVNQYGIIETPFAKVENGVVTKKIVYLNTEEERDKYIAHAGVKRDDKEMLSLSEGPIIARLNGDPISVSDPKKIDLIDVATNQILSVAAGLIPFIEHDGSHRALYGSGTQRQAVPCLVPDAPLVATGIEEIIARSTGRLVIAKEDGVVTEVDGTHIVVKGTGKAKTYTLVKFLDNNNFSMHHQRPIVSVGQKIKEGAVLADSAFSDCGQLALGQNLRVAFTCWYGYNYEDGIVLSEDVLSRDIFTSIHVKKFKVRVLETKLGPEITTCDIPNVSERKLRNLDEKGIVRVGAAVNTGDILVGKVTPKGETQLTAEERLLRSIFGDRAKDVKDTSTKLEPGHAGRVVRVKVFSREAGDQLEAGVLQQIHITIAQYRTMTVGDKISGRHGNKGVVTRILPREDMPYTKDGHPVDVVLSPLGIPSRMNLGQVYEMHAGLMGELANYQVVAPSFAGVTEKEIQKELHELDAPGRGFTQPLYDGVTGEKIGDNIAVGYMYLMKLEHMVEGKLHYRSTGKYSLVTRQPLRGRSRGGGQRVGEMEVWAFLGYGAAHTLREILTIKSDDVRGRSNAFDSIVRGKRIGQPQIPATFNVLVNYLRGLGVDIKTQ